MEYLADHHIIHRDLKSLNILLSSVQGTTEFAAKICDFGLSRFLDHATLVKCLFKFQVLFTSFKCVYYIV
jgi:serine/threonine protein kinase